MKKLVLMLITVLLTVGCSSLYKDEVKGKRAYSYVYNRPSNWYKLENYKNVLVSNSLNNVEWDVDNDLIHFVENGKKHTYKIKSVHPRKYNNGTFFILYLFANNEFPYSNISCMWSQDLVTLDIGENSLVWTNNERK